MKIKTPFSKARLRTHVTYNSWKYLVVILASIFGWNILYTMTAYKSPEHLRIDTYIQGAATSDDTVAAFYKPIWEKYVPDMETITNVILTGTSDDYYSNMQLSVYIMAGEGDIYMLTTQDFKKYAAQGAFIDLSHYIEEGLLQIGDMDLSAGYVATVDDEGLPTGDTQLFGIPAYTLDGFKSGMNVNNDNLIMGVTAFSHNEENTIKFLNGLIEAGLVQENETATP